jgi:hypothetical protein
MVFEGHLRCRVFIMVGVDSDDVLRQLCWREIMEEHIFWGIIMSVVILIITYDKL